MRVVDDSEEVDQINYFLPPIKMLLSVSDISDVISAEGVEIDLCLSQLSEDQGNMAWLEWSWASIAISDRRADEKLLLEPAS